MQRCPCFRLATPGPPEAALGDPPAPWAQLEAELAAASGGASTPRHWGGAGACRRQDGVVLVAGEARMGQEAQAGSAGLPWPRAREPACV